MCNHNWKDINDVTVCLRCGLTVNKLTGKILFDRNIISANNKKRRKKA